MRVLSREDERSIFGFSRLVAKEVTHPECPSSWPRITSCSVRMGECAFHDEDDWAVFVLAVSLWGTLRCRNTAVRARDNCSKTSLCKELTQCQAHGVSLKRILIRGFISVVEVLARQLLLLHQFRPDLSLLLQHCAHNSSRPHQSYIPQYRYPVRVFSIVVVLKTSNKFLILSQSRISLSFLAKAMTVSVFP